MLLPLNLDTEQVKHMKFETPSPFLKLDCLTSSVGEYDQTRLKIRIRRGKWN